TSPLPPPCCSTKQCGSALLLKTEDEEPALSLPKGRRTNSSSLDRRVFVFRLWSFVLYSDGAMRITKVEPLPIDRYLFVQVHTDDGLVGPAESGTCGHPEASEAAT